MQQSPFLQLVRKRRSIRAFKSTKVDEKVVREILQACDLAPSSGGLQTYEIYRIDNADKKKALVSAAMDQAFIAEAPLVLVFCANASRSVHKYGERSGLFSVQDATIAAAYAQLAVYDLGLTTVWVGAFNEKKVSDVLGLPQEHRPVAILPIGHPNEKPKDKTTRGVDDLLHVIR
jgi:nitroreductase